MSERGQVRPASFLDVVRTVLFRAFGVRRRADHERETVAIRPLHLIIAGVAGAVIFVMTLVAIVRLVVSD